MASSLTLEEFEKRIDNMAKAFPGDQTEALEVCDGFILQGIQENFMRSATSRGEPWPQRKDPGPTHALLILDGDLKAAATGQSGIPADNDGTRLIRAMPRGPTGSSLAGVRRHEFGDVAILGSDGILARPYYGVSEDVADSCADAVADGVSAFVMENL